MFIEVNELKGLIFNFKSSQADDIDSLVEISHKLKCVFIYTDEGALEFLQEHVSSHSLFLQKKPFQMFLGTVRSIKQALELLELPPYQVAYVTTNPAELELVMPRVNTGVILQYQEEELDYSFCRNLPDFHIRSLKQLDKIIEGESRGYFSEVCVTFVKNGPKHWNVGSFSNTGALILTRLNMNGANVKVYAFGRYFQYSHPYFSVHQLSRRIIRAKDDNSQDKIFAGLFSGFIRYLKSTKTVDGVTRVPPRPGKRDRLLPIIKISCNESKIPNLSDILICNTDYPTQKGKNSEERLENVQGVFDVTDPFSVSGKHILLVDDVLSTGATVTECAATLIRQGAKEVSIIVLGINQLMEAWKPKKHKITCPNCNKDMIIKFTKDGNRFFFGCSNYAGGCQENLDYLTGLQRINEELYEIELQSEELDFNDF